MGKAFKVVMLNEEVGWYCNDYCVAQDAAALATRMAHELL